ncbi:MAG: hypothetical protein KME06_01120 [Kastovskya adunca ATA6-11-RM4]|jgi:hypothetical protein|nr:hypothetical protein [Kastovskya adunca ATA6-11-RM4]
MFLNYIGLSAGFGILTLLVFGLLQWLNVSAGQFIDWAIAAASFSWLLVIVTIPWNIHFEAREVLAEASVSDEKGIALDTQQLDYVKTVSRRSLLIAIALHLLSAIALYSLAATGISVVGYVSSGAALLLTVLRPIVRAYQYLAARLAMIRQEFNYPREDVVELRYRFSALEEKIKHIEEQMNPEEPYSWVATYNRQSKETQTELRRLVASLETLQAKNEADHQRLAREAQSAIAQLTVDSQFLDHVREIIRFVKTA